MDSAEIQVIKTTWAVPLANPTDSGAAILIKYFTNYPSNLIHFPFRDVPVAELNNSPRFRAHCTRIIRTFDESIKTLEDPEGLAKLKEIWEEIAETHFKRQISRESYNQLKGVILEVLSAACPLDEQQTAVWTKLMDVVYGILFHKLSELEAAGQ